MTILILHNQKQKQNNNNNNLSGLTNTMNNTISTSIFTNSTPTNSLSNNINNSGVLSYIEEFFQQKDRNVNIISVFSKLSFFCLINVFQI
ncbi:hypothetical protein U3516DRAFT_734731 [Neocallimastix sp. 'constans']